MPYNVFVMSLIAHIHGIHSLTDNLDIAKSNEPLKEHMRGLYRGVSVPERFSRAYRKAPWDAANEAIALVMSQIRQQETKKADIITMIRDVEDEYAALYVAPEPAYYTLNAVRQQSVLDFKELLNSLAQKST